MSPYCVLYNKEYDPSLLNALFLYVLIPLLQLRTKFQPRACKWIVLEHKEGVKGYVLFDLNSKQIFLSRHAVFYENMFSFHNNDTFMLQIIILKLFFLPLLILLIYLGLWLCCCQQGSRKCFLIVYFFIQTNFLIVFL